MSGKITSLLLLVCCFAVSARAEDAQQKERGGRRVTFEKPIAGETLIAKIKAVLTASKLSPEQVHRWSLHLQAAAGSGKRLQSLLSQLSRQVAAAPHDKV